MSKISVVICTKNEERNIERCLKSVERLADEIIVFDSMSEDQTPQICRSFKSVRFYQGPWEGFSQTKNKANALATGEYILSMDADEELSDEIQYEILRIKENLQGLYQINRLSNYCGQWVRHSGWFPDRHVRLFPRLNSYWAGDFVHEKLVNTDHKQASDLKGLVYHYSVVSFQDHLKKVKSYSTLGAEKIAQKRPIFLILLSVVINPIVRFLRHYIFKLGILDGRAGFLISTLSAYTVYLKYSKALKIKLS
jgi:glycosyltransferase involved in cell wall biosynthesis